MGYDPLGNWNMKFAFGMSLLLIGVAVIAAVPTGGLSLTVAGATLAISSTTVVAAGAAIGLVGLSVAGSALMEDSIMFARKSRKSGKEKANDLPSYFDRNGVDPNKTAQQNAADALNRQFGKGNWPKGPGSDFNKIVKWIHRGMSVLFMTVEELMEEQNDAA